MRGTKEISEILGVKAVTVRKYAAELERAGYSVSKGDNGHREFSDADAMVFQQLKALCDRPGMTLDLAANAIVSRVARDHNPAMAGDDNMQSERYNERYKEAMELMGKLVEQNQEQSQKMDRLHKRMDEQQGKISSMQREMQETRRHVAAVSRKKLWKLWKFWEKERPDGPDPEVNWHRKQKPENYL